MHLRGLFCSILILTCRPVLQAIFMYFESILGNEHIFGGLYSFFSHPQAVTGCIAAKVRTIRCLLPYICLKTHGLGVFEEWRS